MLERKVLEGFGKELGWPGAPTAALAAMEGSGDTFSCCGSLGRAGDSRT